MPAEDRCTAGPRSFRRRSRHRARGGARLLLRHADPEWVAALAPSDLQRGGFRSRVAQSLLPFHSRNRPGVRSRIDASGARIAATLAGDRGADMRRLLVLVSLLALCACELTFRDMYDQPRYKPLAASRLWPDGRASRPTVEGAIPRSEGTQAGTSSGRNGDVAPAPAIAPLDTIRDTLRPKDASSATFHAPAPTPALLERGRERYDIFCAPCH